MLIKRKSSKNFFLLFQWNSFIKIKNKVLWLLHSLTRNDSNNKYILIRHFSQVTKSRILKNLNLRKKADRNFCRTFLKNRFRNLKLYSNPPSWLARCRCHMGTFWKTKDWSSHFWEGQLFRFWYVECHRQRRLKLTKTGISS